MLRLDQLRPGRVTIVTDKAKYNSYYDIGLPFMCIVPNKETIIGFIQEKDNENN